MLITQQILSEPCRAQGQEDRLIRLCTCPNKRDSNGSSDYQRICLRSMEFFQTFVLLSQSIYKAGIEMRRERERERGENCRINALCSTWLIKPDPFDNSYSQAAEKLVQYQMTVRQPIVANKPWWLVDRALILRCTHTWCYDKSSCDFSVY